LTLALTAALTGCRDATPQSSDSPEPLDAADVSTEIATAMSSLRTLAGVKTIRRADGGTDTGKFMCDAVGNYRLLWDEEAGAARRLQSSIEISEVYNARRHSLTVTYRDPDGGLTSYTWQDSWPFEEPMGGPGWVSVFPLGEVWRVRAALAEGDPSYVVERTTHDGRAAWRVVYLPEADVEPETFVIDRQTGYLVAHAVPASDEEGEAAGHSAAVTALRVDEDLPADAFSTEPPQDARINRETTDYDYFCRLSDVAARSGFGPFVPASAGIPAGFVLSEVATSDRSPVEYVGGWSEPDGRREHRTQFLRYRHGFDSFSVQVGSMRGLTRGEMAQSLTSLTGPSVQERRLAGGPFTGKVARTWLDRNGVNLLVVGDDQTAFISGAVTRAEAYALAEALVDRGARASAEYRHGWTVGDSAWRRGGVSMNTQLLPPGRRCRSIAAAAASSSRAR